MGLEDTVWPADRAEPIDDRRIQSAAGSTQPLLNLGCCALQDVM